MSSKTFELYDEVLFQLKRFIEKYSGFKNFQEIKVMCDFEIPLRKAIKENFPGCILQGCFFHFCKEIYCKKINDFCLSLGGEYPKLNKYFLKYWKNLELFDFTTLEDNKIKNRTNNICESFHRKLNHEISHYHPKCAYLVSEFKRITANYYNDYIKLLSNKKIKKKM